MDTLLFKGKTIPYYKGDYFEPHELFPKDFIQGRVISPLEFIHKQEIIKSEYPIENQTKIYIRSIEELQHSTCLELFDGDGFVAITEEGEIVSVLKKYGSKVTNFMSHAFANAMAVGGSKLDCYDCENLGPSYSKRGFIPICRISFDCYCSHPNMIRYYGEPDIIFYMYCGDPINVYWQKVKDGDYTPLSDYDYIPRISDIQASLDMPLNDMNYDFAHKFRDMIWGKWNSGLKKEFMFRPYDLMEYVCSDYERLESWLRQ